MILGYTSPLFSDGIEVIVLLGDHHSWLPIVHAHSLFYGSRWDGLGYQHLGLVQDVGAQRG